MARTRSEARSPDRTDPSIVAGKPDESQILDRLRATDKSRMPPKEAGDALAKEKIAVLERWIAQGAKLAVGVEDQKRRQPLRDVVLRRRLLADLRVVAEERFRAVGGALACFREPCARTKERGEFVTELVAQSPKPQPEQILQVRLERETGRFSAPNASPARE